MTKNLNQPLVSICCITFNHAPYIRQCLDGFVMQQTSFPFEIIIHDDASTDGTQDIIKEYIEKYPLLFKPILQEQNQYSKGIRSILATFCYPKASGKYIALCEGDDYWTDPLKLQKQVDFLEANPDYGMCYGKSQTFNQVSKKITGTRGNSKCSFKELVIANCIPTATVLYRIDLFKKYQSEIKPENYNWKMGDKPVWLWFALNSKIYFFDSNFAVYRVVPNSASHFSSLKPWFEFLLNAFEISLHFIQIAGIDPSFLLPSYYFNNIAYSVITEDKTSTLKYKKLLKPHIKNLESKKRILYLSMYWFPKITTSMIKCKFKLKNKLNSW